MAEGMKDYLRSAAIAAGPIIGAIIGGTVGYLISGSDPQSYRLGIGAGSAIGAAAVGAPLVISGIEI